MKIRKIGKNHWHWAGNMAWQLKAKVRSLYHDKIDLVEWHIPIQSQHGDYVTLFVASCFGSGLLVARLSGKAIYDGGNVHLIISEHIEY